MNKKVFLTLLFIPFVLLMGWVGYLTYQKESGVEVRLPIRGYDPRDLLSGHYIQYEIDWDRANCSQFEQGICPKQNFCKKARWGHQCRFYISEKYARQLDRLFWNRNRTDMVFEVVYSYHPGQQAMAKQLLINGKDWKEFVK